MKKLLSFGLVSMTVLTLGAPFAHAANVEGHSNADVKFTQNTDPLNPTTPEVVDPTDPTGPEKPVVPGTDPEEGQGGFGTQSFGINFVSNFKFGEIKIASTQMSQFAAPTTLNFAKVDENGNTVLGKDGQPELSGVSQKVANFIQVRDARGTNAGWHITVAGTEFKEYTPAVVDEETGKVTTPGAYVADGDTLPGAQILLNDPVVIGAGEQAPTGVPTTVVDVLGETGSKMVLNAKETEGAGTWGVYWGATSAANPALAANKGVQLIVPVNANPQQDKTYRSDLTWTLNETPEA